MLQRHAPRRLFARYGAAYQNGRTGTEYWRPCWKARSAKRRGVFAISDALAAFLFYAGKLSKCCPTPNEPPLAGPRPFSSSGPVTAAFTGGIYGMNAAVARFSAPQAALRSARSCAHPLPATICRNGPGAGRCGANLRLRSLNTKDSCSVDIWCQDRLASRLHEDEHSRPRPPRPSIIAATGTDVVAPAQRAVHARTMAKWWTRLRKKQWWRP